MQFLLFRFRAVIALAVDIEVFYFHVDVDFLRFGVEGGGVVVFAGGGGVAGVPGGEELFGGSLGFFRS